MECVGGHGVKGHWVIGGFNEMIFKNLNYNRQQRATVEDQGKALPPLAALGS